MLVIDKPILSSVPPELPPYLKRKGEPRRRVIIMPSLEPGRGSTQLIKDFNNNWQTVVHNHMIRITHVEGQEDVVEFAHSHSRRYRDWLSTYETTNGVPPHIMFSGCIESGQGDPTFKSRWEAWAREMFA